MTHSPDPSVLDGQDRRFGQALALAIMRRRLPLAALSDRLREMDTPVSIATLSYWQSGRSLPTRQRSRMAVQNLEKLLSVPVGGLTSLLPSDLSSRWEPLRAVPYDDQALALLSGMGIDPVGAYTTVMFHDTTRVSADHRRQYETTRQVIRSERDGLDRIALVMRQNFLEDPAPLIATQEGCRAGRVVQLDDQGLFAAELVLDRPLAAGDLHRLQYLLVEEMPGDVCDGGFTRVLPHEVPYLVLDVVFDQSSPPRVQYRTTPRAYVGTSSTNALCQDLPRGRFVQVAISDASAGMHEVVWDY